MIKFIHKSYLPSWYIISTKHSPKAIITFLYYKRHLHATQRLKTPTLIVNPRVSMYDVKPNIRVEGLEPQKPVTLKAQMKEDKGKLLYANAHYIADNNGVVDVAVSPSLSGSYKGIFPTGLLSSLKIASGHFEFGRIHKNNMYEPVKIKITVLDGHKPIEEDEGELDRVEMERHLLGKGVQRIPVREGRVRGVLYLPEGDGPFPGVIDMFGATGNLFESRAALNATRGLASLALAYFNYDDLPVEQLYKLEIEYFEEAIEYLLSHPKVKSDRCGVVGNCFGGVVSYQMGLYLSKLKAVFLINTSYNYFMGELYYKGKVVASGFPTTEIVSRKDTDGTYIPREDYNKMLADVKPSQVELLNNTLDDQHFAIAIGEDDCFQFQDGWHKLADRLSEKKRNNFTLKTYPKAGHLIHPPYSPFAPIIFGQMWSQDPNYSLADMQEDVWQWMFDFFLKHLGDKF